MLAIRNQEHFARVVRFARKTDQLSHLTDILWYLHTYRESTAATPRKAPELVSEAGIPASWLAHADGKRNTCDLQSDFAPASFYFVMTFGLNGGVIYHGNQAGWSDKPDTYTDPLSVRTARSENPWSVHT